MLGYKTVIREVKLPCRESLRFDMSTEAIALQEVNVIVKPIKAQGDTLIYNVEAFKSGADNTIEDVIRRMLGISVAENGSIKYQGKPINHFYIEGLDMLQGRYSLATRNISADDIATVDVYENHQPVKVLEDVVYSDKAALNLTLKKKSLLRPVGRVAAGGGYGGGRGLWLGELSALMVSPALQLMAVAKTNNSGASYGDEMSEHTLVADRRCVADNIFLPKLGSEPALSRQRYDFNRSEIASVNAMSRLNSDNTIGISASYDRNRSDVLSQNTIAYFVDDAEPVVIENSVTELTTVHRVKTGADVTINGKRVFLRNRLSYNATFRDNSSDVSGIDNVHQGFGLDNLGIDNRLVFTMRRGNRVWDFRSTAFL